MTDRFRRTAKGVAVSLEPRELAVLARIPDLVGGVGRDDPAADRLNPAVFRDDPAASSEFERLAGAEIAASRTNDLDRFTATLDEVAEGGQLSIAEVEAWLRTLGTARVVLAARKPEISDDASFARASRRDPDVLLIDYLGLLQEEMVAVLLADLPAGGEA